MGYLRSTIGGGASIRALVAIVAGVDLWSGRCRSDRRGASSIGLGARCGGSDQRSIDVRLGTVFQNSVMRYSNRKEMAMNPQDITDQLRDSMTVRRVFGDSYEKDGVTVIPVAKVRGGGGAGNSGESGKGTGGGFGLTASPEGVYVIKDGNVDWKPAVNVNLIVAGAQITCVIALLVIRGILKARSR